MLSSTIPKKIEQKQKEHGLRWTSIRHGTAIEHFLHSTNLHNNNIIHTPTMAIHNCNNTLHSQWTTIRSLLCEWGSLPNMAMPQLGNNTIVLACQLLYLHANAFIARNSIDKNASHFALCMIYISCQNYLICKPVERKTVFMPTCMQSCILAVYT